MNDWNDEVARFALNPSILLGDRPRAEQLRLAREHGFEEVEFWWPFETTDPDADEISAFIRDIRSSGLRLIALNLYEGGMPEGNRGLASQPGREAEFRATLEGALRIGEALECGLFNVLYGNRMPGVSASEQDLLAIDSVAHAAERLATIGGTVLLENLSTIPDYPLKSFADARAAYLRILPAVSGGNLAILVDAFHVAAMGEDLVAVVSGDADLIGHVQLADFPGRGGPGTGSLPLPAVVAAARAAGYTGRFALEYSAYERDQFEWMDLPAPTP